LKEYSTKEFCYGILLISASISLYAFFVHKLVLAPILVLSICVVFSIFIIGLRVCVREGFLVISYGSKQLSEFDIQECSFYSKYGLKFDLVTHHGRCIWMLNLVSDRGSLIEEIFASRIKDSQLAQINTTILIKKIILTTGIVISLALCFTPLIQYGQLPDSESELHEVHGVLLSIDLDKILKLKLRGYEPDLFVSQQMGDLERYRDELSQLLGKKVSFWILKGDNKSSLESIRVWSITNDLQSFLSLNDVADNWIDWKRWGVLLLVGGIGFAYSVTQYGRLGKFRVV
jgi:hypothetical protein